VGRGPGVLGDTAHLAGRLAHRRGLGIDAHHGIGGIGLDPVGHGLHRGDALLGRGLALSHLLFAQRLGLGQPIAEGGQGADHLAQLVMPGILRQGRIQPAGGQAFHGGGYRHHRAGDAAADPPGQEQHRQRDRTGHGQGELACFRRGALTVGHLRLLQTAEHLLHRVQLRLHLGIAAREFGGRLAQPGACLHQRQEGVAIQPDLGAEIGAFLRRQPGGIQRRAERCQLGLQLRHVAGIATGEVVLFVAAGHQDGNLHRQRVYLGGAGLHLADGAAQLALQPAVLVQPDLAHRRGHALEGQAVALRPRHCGRHRGLGIRLRGHRAQRFEITAERLHRIGMLARGGFILAQLEVLLVPAGLQHAHLQLFQQQNGAARLGHRRGAGIGALDAPPVDPLDPGHAEQAHKAQHGDLAADAAVGEKAAHVLLLDDRESTWASVIKAP